MLALAVGFGAGGCNESDDGDTSDDVVPDAGADEYIMKPFDKDIVEAKFAEVGLI